MESLQDILGQKNFTPPDEISVIKDYVARRYKSACSVKFERNSVILSVTSPTLAATIQLERQGLINACGLKNKRLAIRSGR